jgi:hypothetical protein
MRPATKKVTRDASTKDVCLKPPISRSRQPRGLLTSTTKREEKEDNNQHEDRDQEGLEQLQEMQESDHQDQDHDNQEGH